MILVSSCLLGCACRYKGDDCKNEKILKLAKEHVLLGVCPEQMGGLETPRDPSEIVGDKVLSCAGRDVTAQYQKGAEAALYLAKLNHVDFAILKAKSPSCGKELIYDGTFTGNKVPGNGVTVSLLLENGIPVYTEDELDQLPL
ncbi:DUF523 domain-containing protein [Anaeromassilibacillus senegalensis]|uniref:DUF523 domain-containing protein n=1 Tax=Anaeromassilibacillus senegalensis TaxID=1673717 RepID=UPI003B00C886